ncbi:sulfate permease [Enemella evansiae]|uniref:sulfate permease n=1 Tax=Enemella evansiae TaxID=2016499 RepID=UPI001E44AAB0|nr:sulfate permease [Enemella evansiae]
MLRLLWTLSVHTRTYMRRYMPTNRLLDAIRTRRGLKWGIPATLLAIPSLFAVALCRALIEDGGPGWLHLLVLLCIWNAMKLTIIGPASVWYC